MITDESIFNDVLDFVAPQATSRLERLVAFRTLVRPFSVNSSVNTPTFLTFESSTAFGASKQFLVRMNPHVIHQIILSAVGDGTYRTPVGLFTGVLSLMYAQ
jgi:hypothetical protein